MDEDNLKKYEDEDLIIEEADNKKGNPRFR